MGMNFTIRNLDEWHQLNVSLSKAADYMAEAAEGDGTNGSEITMAFTERYYEPYDTF